MDWEDCVVDVHSVKLSKQMLETIFQKCGALRSITHWKGQGEKPHVFFEYKAPSATESARAVGLDRNDLQVIKISNNEMLKKKFRELAHGPIYDQDEPWRHPRPSSHPTSSHHSWDSSISATGKDHRLPAKPTSLFTYSSDRDALGRFYGPRSAGVGTNDRQSRPSTSATTPLSRTPHSSPPQSNSYRVPSMGSTTSQFSSTFTQDRIETSASNLRPREHTSSGRRGDDRASVFSRETRAVMSSSFPLTPPTEASSNHKTRPTNENASLAVIEIPHAGEVIKFDLDSQLETDPAGIIRILTAVKAEQKLWMMTAAHYRGKHNLESAKKVLEAGIDMAVQVGEETDTKPFWHLLGQINGNLRALASPTTSFVAPVNSSPDTIDRVASRTNNTPPVKSSPSMKENLSLLAVAHDSNIVPAPAKLGLNDHSKFVVPTANKPFSVPQLPGPSQPSPGWPCREHETHPIPPPHSPVPPAGPMGAPARLYNLQNEIGALREKQNALLADLSFARAAKRRAEDDVKEERSVRRKLEKHLRATEDALGRSKRMEDAALDQVRREVESRRRAEGLLADIKARNEVETSIRGYGAGHALLANPSANDAAVLLQLASLIRGVPSSAALQFGTGGAGAVPPSTGP